MRKYRTGQATPPVDTGPRVPVLQQDDSDPVDVNFHWSWTRGGYHFLMALEIREDFIKGTVLDPRPTEEYVMELIKENEHRRYDRATGSASEAINSYLHCQTTIVSQETRPPNAYPVLYYAEV
ncbi:hypothetical protein J6590_012204 [Homalodisca vitripennis]|nr:hypothetical protein J6590_012204 [Homalodisca vitripennis]